MKRLCCLLGVAILACSAFADPPYHADRIVILPFTAVGIDEVSAQSAETILEIELQKRSAFTLISPRFVRSRLPDTYCSDAMCASEVARQFEAGHAIVVTLSRLGEKVLAQYLFIDAVTQKVLISDHTSSTTIEDLEAVMQRIALSILSLKPISQTAEVGSILEKETAEPRVRQGRRQSGFSFGYLYPKSGYDRDDRSFAMDFRTGYEAPDFAAGMLFGLRKGFATHVYLDYLLTRTDICPYIGGSFGFHWVSHDDDDAPENGDHKQDKKGDGFEVGVQAGLRIFRTWNFEVLINAEYLYTFNDYDDQAVIFTVGLLK